MPVEDLILPPYPPELNPITSDFAEHKALWRNVQSVSGKP